jgi:hypothetical protein
MIRLHTLTEGIALRMLARDGIAAIWQLQVAAAIAHRTGSPGRQLPSSRLPKRQSRSGCGEATYPRFKDGRTDSADGAENAAAPGVKGDFLEQSHRPNPAQRSSGLLSSYRDLRSFFAIAKLGAPAARAFEPGTNRWYSWMA